MIASLSPISAEMAAESTAPARPFHAYSFRRECMRSFATLSSVGAGIASMRLRVMLCEVFFEKIYGRAEIACKHLGSLLVGFFMSFPVCLFDKGSLAAGTEVLVLLAA
jgi:hypothetical protein